VARPSHREKILCEGLKVVHERGFAGASVRDIVRAAGVPQGSFTNHFASKEAFGLEILDLYFADTRQAMSETLLNDALPPLRRLGDYLDRNIANFSRDESHGCLIGNFSAEVVDQSEAMRLRLVEIFDEVRAAFAHCLRAAVAAGELPAGFDVEGVAGFLLSGLQGATLVAKAERSPAPIERLKALLFTSVLR
jgi:TetR/AcrR family transcriptional regulator, transcriptional repressor for nem operon